MPKKKTPSSILIRGCQASCAIIFALVIFFIMLFIQDAGFVIPFANLIVLVVFILAILIAIGIITGRCQPSMWGSWDML